MTNTNLKSATVAKKSTKAAAKVKVEVPEISEVIVEKPAVDFAKGLEAALTAKRVSRSGATSEFTDNIIKFMGTAGQALSPNQVRAAFIAMGLESEDVKSKKFADRMWLLAKRGSLIKNGDGTYSLA